MQTSEPVKKCVVDVHSCSDRLGGEGEWPRAWDPLVVQDNNVSNAVAVIK